MSKRRRRPIISDNNYEKILNAKFSVGDVVKIKSDSKRVSYKGRDDKRYEMTQFIVPNMVVTEVFYDEKVHLFKIDKQNGDKQKIKDVGDYPIKVKCIWFCKGQYQEKIFWQDVLELTSSPPPVTPPPPSS